ncbi:MAG: aldehyde dehydrogenase family protein [Candidatus Bathyarchaeia archaeon]
MSDVVLGRTLLAGEWIETGQNFAVLNKYSGKVVDYVPLCTEREVEAALASAEHGARHAEKMLGHERASILERAATKIEADASSIGSTIVAEAGIPIKHAKVEVKRAAVTLRFSAEESKRIVGETIPFDAQPRGADRYGYFLRKPVGIVAAIIAFNGPFLLACRKMGPAIAAGNAGVLKPASVTPLSTIKFAEIMLDAGLPPESLQILTGKGAVIGRKLVGDQRVRVVSLTGGAEAGAEVARYAELKRLVMELGSICPTIVMDDAPQELALDCLPEASFALAGQNCIRPQQLLVHEKIYSEFVESFVERTSKLVVGDPALERTDVGPLISEHEAIRVESWVHEAEQAGAKILIGGRRDGVIYSPTILTECPASTKVIKQEIFGPVVVVDNFSNLGEAIDKSNSTTYGLQAGIFTQDIDVAYRAVNDLNFGGVLINDTSDFNSDLMPFGGTKQSGLGREGVRWAIQEMTDQRTVVYRIPH